MKKPKILKYIQFSSGKGKSIYHISIGKGKDFQRVPIYGSTYNNDDSYVACCNGNFAVYGDYINDKPPKSGSLCKRCKKEILKYYTIEELMIELL